MNFIYSRSFSQNLTIQVTSDKGDILEYPDIQLVGKIHKIGSVQGELLIPDNIISIGDTLKVRYLGYLPRTIIVSNQILHSSLFKVILEQKTFELSEVVVLKCHNNSAELYEKRKKKNLYPYTKKHEMDIYYDYKCSDAFLSKGKQHYTFNNTKVLLDNDRIIEDSLENHILMTLIKRGIELSYTHANWLCKKHVWSSKFYCDFLGEENKSTFWQFTVHLKKTWSDIAPQDKVNSIVVLGEDDIIKKIETSFIVTDSLKPNKFYSYITESNFIFNKGKIIPSKIIFKLLPNEKTAGKDREITLILSNFKKD